MITVRGALASATGPLLNKVTRHNQLVMMGKAGTDPVATSKFVEGPAPCALCGEQTNRRPRFLAAFPDRDPQGRAAFPLSGSPPVPSWRMTECERCHCVTPLPYPSAEKIAEFYREVPAPAHWEDEADWEMVHYIRLDWNPKALEGVAELADKFTRLCPPGRLLEVGCATGWLLAALRDRGWQVAGVEAKPKFSVFARERLELDIHEGLISDAPLARWSNFDVIVALDTFEHLHDPVGDLRRLRQAANDDAYLILTTPDISSFIARRYGLRWRQILPSHINYSTPTSMRIALNRAGWRLEHLSEPRYWDPDGDKERRQRLVEVAKLFARWALVYCLVKPSGRMQVLRRVPALLTRNRLSWDDFQYRVGDQPVLGDVMLVIARPANVAST